tara:strand:+ start:904 stop:1200 length:297 start_codon:yes stop_codon:yes gene_type:complete
MEKELVLYIVAQRAEAEAFTAAAPGNFMGKLPCHTDTEYWSERVPSGTFAEFERQELEETAYYVVADFISKSAARSLNLTSMSNDEIRAFTDKILEAA